MKSKSNSQLIPASRLKKSSLFFCLILMVISCNKEEGAPDFTDEDRQSVTTESLEDSYFNDSEDVTLEAMESDDGPSGGKVAGTDSRLSCATITRDGDDSSGTLKIDFADGCKDTHGNVRKGVILIQRTGHWNVAGSQWTIAFLNYSINDILIEGLRTVSVISATDSLIITEVTISGGKATWPDGRVATRELKHRREHERHLNHLLDRLIIYGNAQGLNRYGRGYSIEILERLIYRRACIAEGIMIPVKGVKLVKHGNRELTIDYGDGTCDNIVVLTNKNGRSVRYEIGK